MGTINHLHSNNLLQIIIRVRLILWLLHIFAITRKLSDYRTKKIINPFGRYYTETVVLNLILHLTKSFFYSFSVYIMYHCKALFLHFWFQRTFLKICIYFYIEAHTRYTSVLFTLFPTYAHMKVYYIEPKNMKRVLLVIYKNK